MKKYNVVLFDLDDTLFDTASDELRAIETVFKKHGLPFGDDVVSLYKNRTPWYGMTLGEMNAKVEFTSNFAQLLSNIGVTENRSELINDYFCEMTKSHTLTKGAYEVVKELKNRGYRVYITANGYTEFQNNRLKDSELDGCFDGVFVSEDTDTRKPSKAYFDYVFSRVPESNKSKYILVGDAQSTDILGANNAKIDSCWYNPLGKTPKYKSTYEIADISDLLNILTNKQ